MIGTEEFQQRAGAACQTFFGSLLSEFLGSVDTIDPATGEPLLEDEQALGQRVIDLGDEFTSEPRAIGAPEGQVERWNEWLELLDESVDQQRQEPLAAVADDESVDPERAQRIDELSEELGVPECAEPDVEKVEIDHESATALARLFADGIRIESDGLVDETEAGCIADGVLDEFTVNELLAFDDGDELPVDQQAAVFDVMAACLPTEKLVQLGS